MVIFHSYVSLPEGNDQNGIHWYGCEVLCFPMAGTFAVAEPLPRPHVRSTAVEVVHLNLTRMTRPSHAPKIH